MQRAVEIVAKVAPRAFANYVRAFDAGDSRLKQSGITTPLRMAHFLAQVLHETGGGTVLFEDMRYTTKKQLLKIFGFGNHTAAIREDEADEFLDNPEALAERVYGLGNPVKAKELGNKRSGDGFRFRGGGLLQTTGGANYQRMGELIGADFVDDPKAIVAPENALQPALQEWDDGKLNDAADRNNIITITKVINGGLNGIDERKALFDQIWGLVRNGDASASWQAADDDDDTAWLQTALNNLGTRPSLLVDGRYGPATEQAVEQFQGVAGIKVDGVAGEVTRAAIRLRLQVT